MAAFLNVCRFTPTAGSTTDWTYSAAVTGYQSPALAGVVNSRVYKYRAESADLTQWEIGEGAYNTGTGVLARTTVLYNSSGTGTGTGQSGAGTKINFSTIPQVAIVAVKEDLLAVEEANTFTAAQKAQAQTNLGMREVLTANRTYYIRTDGSNSNNGLANTAGGAFLTLQKAYDVISSSLDFGGYDVTVQIGDGTYTAGVLIDAGWHGGGSLTWQGNSGTPTNVLVNVTSGNDFKAIAVLPGPVIIKDMELRTTTSGVCIDQSAAGLVQFQNITFGAAQIHLNCGSGNGGSGANLECTGNYTISGAASFAHIVCSRPSNTNIRSRTITITGTPALATFALVANGAVLAIDGCTFSGSATGIRYAVSNGGQIFTNGAATTYLPGGTAGTGTNYGASPWGLYA